MSTTNIFTPFTEEELMPKEEKLEVIKKKQTIQHRSSQRNLSE